MTDFPTPVRELALGYFAAFAAKDLPRLESLLDEGATLRDWTVDLVGRQAVLAEMGRLFVASHSIVVAPVRLNVDGRIVAAELDISIDAERLKVVDILEFSAHGRLFAIRAYRG